MLAIMGLLSVQQWQVQMPSRWPSLVMWVCGEVVGWLLLLNSDVRFLIRVPLSVTCALCF